jgi:uracil-DNA glycosylase
MAMADNPSTIDPRPAIDPANPRRQVEQIVRGLRSRLNGEARAGLTAVARQAASDESSRERERAGAPASAAGAPDSVQPRAYAHGSAAAAPDATESTDEEAAASPGAMAAALKAELAVQAKSPPAAEDAAGDSAAAPAVHVRGPELFDLHSPDLAGGMTHEDALARVAAEVAVCPKCPDLVAGRTLTVPGTGNPYAKLMFIGEAPGQEEDRQGLPFVGRAGELLTKMIASIGMTREDVFIANIVKCRPPANRQPTPEESACCAPFLARQIEVIRPKVIVALGGVAAQNLLQTHDGITRLRGRFYPYMGAKLMPTFHPAYVLRNYTPDTRKKVYDDLLKARAELDG